MVERGVGRWRGGGGLGEGKKSIVACIARAACLRSTRPYNFRVIFPAAVLQMADMGFGGKPRDDADDLPFGMARRGDFCAVQMGF